MDLTNLILLQASNAAPQQGGSMWMSLGMMILLVLVFWLFFIRPQNKKQKELQRQRAALAIGDKIITAGGIHGTIREISEAYFLVEVDKNIHIRIEKSHVYPVGQ